MSFGHLELDNQLNAYSDLGEYTVRPEQSLRWAQVLPQIQEDAKESGSFKPHLIPLDQVIGVLIPSLQASITEYHPVFSMGVKSWWSLQLTTPFYRAEYEGRRDLVIDQDFLKVMKDAGAEEIIETIKNKNSYRESGEINVLADIQLMNTFGLIESRNFYTLLKLGANLPTSEINKSNRTDHVLNDQGQYDVITGIQFGIVHSSNFHSRIITEYNFQLKDSLIIGKQTEDGILDVEINRNLGNIRTLGYQANYYLGWGFSVSGSYTYINKEEDEFSSDHLRTSQLNALAVGTSHESHWVGAGIFYRDLGSFSDREEGLPVYFSLNAQKAVLDENTLNDERVGFSIGLTL